MLRVRREDTRLLLRTFGWNHRADVGWVFHLASPKLAILDLRTLHWRACEVGTYGQRGWLWELLQASIHLFRLSPHERPLKFAHMVENMRGPWPELVQACAEESERQREIASHLFGCALDPGGQVSTVDTPNAHERVSLNDTEASEDGVITVITQRPAAPLLECHGWPYEPDQAPNVVTFLRPWQGPRGGNGGAA